MTTDAIAALEYETMVFERHFAGRPGRSRRTRGELDQSAYTLLSLLHARGPSSIGELSAVTGLDASTLNRQTSALLRHGHAERIADPAGGVARKFRMSDAGARALTEERTASREALQGLTDDWSARDRAALADLLGRLNRAIEQRTGRDWPRP